MSCSLDFSYIQYSNVAAKVVRRCLKGDALKTDAAKREVTSIKFAKWEGGKQVGKCKLRKINYVNRLCRPFGKIESFTLG